MIKLLPLLLSGLLLSGCSIFEDDEEEQVTVAPLVEFDAQFEPKVVWTNSVGDGVEDFFSRLHPEIAGGRVYVADRAGLVKALDQLSGKEIWSASIQEQNESFWGSLWSASASARVSGGILAVDDKLFVGTENGEVYALSANNGELLWRAEVKGEVVATPAYGSGTLVVNSSSGVLTALDVESGEQLWVFEQDVPPLTLRGVGSPVIGSGAAIVGMPNGKMTVVLLENGRQAWEEAIATPSGATDLERLADIDGTPILSAGTIYAVSYNGNLAAIELRTGRVIWKREYSSYQSVAMQGIQLAVTNADSHVFALDRRSGIETWSQLGLFGRELTSPVYYKEYVIVGDEEGYLHFLSREDGSFVARIEIDTDGLYTAPVVSDDMIYMQSRSGEIWAITAP